VPKVAGLGAHLTRDMVPRIAFAWAAGGLADDDGGPMPARWHYRGAGYLQRLLDDADDYDDDAPEGRGKLPVDQTVRCRAGNKSLIDIFATLVDIDVASERDARKRRENHESECQ
jgi:hypothetical protein